METHVKIIAVLHIILGGMGIFAAAVVFVLMGGWQAFASSQSNEVPIISGAFGFIFLVLILLWVPGIVGGIGLLRLASWARVFMIVMSALDLLGFPFGTALGVYGLWALTRAQTKALFTADRAGESPAPPLPT